MIIITGDTHRKFHRIGSLCDANELTADDLIIILGDAGINYSLDQSDCDLKEALLDLPCPLFLIHGNHEERPAKIRTYKEQKWRGGTVYIEEKYPNLIFAKDGEIYDFDGKKAIVIGGAYSIDKWTRLQYEAPWFETEQPNDKTKAYVERQLEKVDWKVDYVFSHTAPLKYEPREEFLPGVKQMFVDKSTERWLGSIESRLEYERWFLGHYHCNKKIDRITILFEGFEELQCGK